MSTNPELIQAPVGVSRGRQTECKNTEIGAIALHDATGSFGVVTGATGTGGRLGSSEGRAQLFPYLHTGFET